MIAKKHILRKVIAYITTASVFSPKEKEIDLFLNSRIRSNWDFLQQKVKECYLDPTKKKKKNQKGKKKKDN